MSYDATATVRRPVTITHKQKSFKPVKCKLKTQKEIKKYWGEISTFDLMSYDFKWNPGKEEKLEENRGSYQ